MASVNTERKAMLYPQDFEQRIGMDRIRSMTERYCNTSLAKKKLSDVTMMINPKMVIQTVSETDEMRTILMMENNFPHDGFVDTFDFLNRVRAEGAYLTTIELGTLRNALVSVDGIVRFFKASRDKGKYPFLSRLTQRVESYPSFILAINQIIDQHHNVKDNASELLSEIRHELRTKERESTKKMQSILQQAKSAGIVDDDANMSVRDGKVLIPVNAASKRKLKGFIYDESATGKTVYIEPLEVVELNNELRELRHNEAREVVRILIDFTTTIRPDIESLLQSADFLAEVDFIRAKAKLALDIDARKPIITPEPIINLRSARHPMLEKALKKERKPIIPLNLCLTKDKHILVISGPNAGGKSVCLKTTALVQLMLQCGFLVPVAENTELTIFYKLFIDIGDQQSIDNDLSTYSSHLTNMKNILRYADRRSLVLIDEFGTGTEPSLGGAIAETILERIEAKGAFGVITTHYTNIKYYASSAKGVVNGAMTFDVQNIKPLFELEMGKPGSSFAFEIARKIGLPEDVVKEAQGKIGEGQINIERQLREIARDKNYWANKRDKIRISEKRYDGVISDYEQKLSEIKEQRSAIIKRAKEEAEQLLSEANKRIENTIRAIKEAGAERERTKEIRAEFTEFKEKVESVVASEEDLRIEKKITKLRDRERLRGSGDEKSKEKRKTTLQEQKVDSVAKNIFEVGDTVRMKGQFVAGEIVSIDNKRVTVVFGNLSTSTTISKLEHISNAEYKRQVKEVSSVGSNSGMAIRNEMASNYSPFDKRLNFKTEIDLRGARVEEAIDIVSIFIDEAVMLGCSDLKILHGKGTGALKEEIRKYLRTIPFVLSANDEHVEFGGSGITVIKLDL